MKLNFDFYISGKKYNFSFLRLLFAVVVFSALWIYFSGAGADFNFNLKCIGHTYYNNTEGDLVYFTPITTKGFSTIKTPIAPSYTSCDYFNYTDLPKGYYVYKFSKENRGYLWILLLVLLVIIYMRKKEKIKSFIIHLRDMGEQEVKRGR